MLQQGLEGLASRLGADQHVAGVFQDGLESHEVIRLVVDQQNIHLLVVERRHELTAVSHFSERNEAI